MEDRARGRGVASKREATTNRVWNAGQERRARAARWGRWGIQTPAVTAAAATRCSPSPPGRPVEGLRPVRPVGHAPTARAARPTTPSAASDGHGAGAGSRRATGHCRGFRVSNSRASPSPMRRWWAGGQPGAMSGGVPVGVSRGGGGGEDDPSDAAVASPWSRLFHVSPLERTAWSEGGRVRPPCDRQRPSDLPWPGRWHELQPAAWVNLSEC